MLLGQALDRSHNTTKCCRTNNRCALDAHWKLKVMLRTCAGRCRRASFGGTRKRTFPMGRTRRVSPQLRPCCCLEPALLAGFETSLPLSLLRTQQKELALQSLPPLRYSWPPSRVQNGVRHTNSFPGRDHERHASHKKEPEVAARLIQTSDQLRSKKKWRWDISTQQRT